MHSFVSSKHEIGRFILYYLIAFVSAGHEPQLYITNLRSSIAFGKVDFLGLFSTTHSYISCRLAKRQRVAIRSAGITHCQSWFLVDHSKEAHAPCRSAKHAQNNSALTFIDKNPTINHFSYIDPAQKLSQNSHRRNYIIGVEEVQCPLRPHNTQSWLSMMSRQS